ncbi:MAG TPA: universal stress protein [Novosphingobium sp.]|nr:universal stress protein [Novosphingobium sp.]
MRSILVNADRRPEVDARLQTAVALARVVDGCLTVLVDTPVARYVSMDPMGGSYVASDALSQAMEDDDANAARIEAMLRAEGLGFTMIRSEAEPVEALAKAARLADLVLLSRSSGLAGELALSSRTPVLVLNDHPSKEVSGTAIPFRTVCVAWDGGDEAVHSLRASVPLLAMADTVQVLTVAEKPGGFAPGEALRYLNQHEVTAELKELTRHGSTEETLSRAVAEAGADLLVLGAFGKSRMREYLFGGVTRYFLEHRNSPSLFLAH